MKNPTVLISGASVAGPALAYWLDVYGFRPTVVERAPALREGGFAVDFRGTAHLTVLRRMGILEEVRRQQTGMGEQVVVDETGKRLAAMPSELMSGDVEIYRGDLSRILYDRTKDNVEYVFDDSITSMRETPDGVDVTFERGEPRTFDLVVGADGLHSNVRRLAFGAESTFLRFLGHYIAGWEVPNHLGLDRTGLIYNVPGKGVTLAATRDPRVAGAGLVFSSPRLDYDRGNVAGQKKLLADLYTGVGWEVPRLLEGLWDAPDLYFDSISQIHLEHFSTGRVVLLGDAGYGATVGGLGTGLAIVAAYVLAGELARAGGDHQIAFTRYEERVKDYARGCQKLAGGVGSFLAPATAGRIRRRDLTYRMLSAPMLAGVFNKLTTKAANAITLEDYTTVQAVA
jgi:2-polyprenyl-6-methoxyphenol hydroxylase-like FAD-dependent oxidoreductase